ncbi:MAG: hypothetical protein JWO38_935 [Gemmataceae bacterium]|nr:hypothetical protein [Gemmataceae bacterium]
MADDQPDYRRRGTLARAVGIHGTDTEEEYYSHPLVVLFQGAVALTPLATAAGAAAGAAFTSGLVFWGCSALAALLAWPSLVGLVGALRLVAGMQTVALIYKDRVLVQRGSSFEDVSWDDVESVYVRTRAGNSDNLVFYEPGSRFVLWVGTAVPLAKFWTEWTEMHTRDGRVIRLPSTISDYDNLSRAVQSGVSFRAWPRALADHRAGRPVSFGPLTVEAEGLRIGSFRIRWADHQCTWSEGGRVVTINTSGMQVGPAILTEQVPNLAVAAYLVNQISTGSVNPASTDES